MEYRIEDATEDSAIVHFNGNITFSENVRFKQLLSDLSDKEIDSVIFNLENVEMVDSSGLGMFQIAKEHADNANWKLRVEGASGHVAGLFKLTKLTDILTR